LTARQRNDRLREAIAASGLGYDGVARAVVRIAAENGEALQTNKSAVAHWVNGVRPNKRTAAYLAEALTRRAGRPVTLAQLEVRHGQRTVDGRVEGDRDDHEKNPATCWKVRAAYQPTADVPPVQLARPEGDGTRW